MSKAEKFPLKSMASNDNNVEWGGILHDSRDSFYRNPGWGTQKTGAVEVGTDVVMRIQSFKDDLTAATLRIWDGPGEKEILLNMQKSSTTDVYDYWEATIISPFSPSDYYYAFLLTDGSDSDWYGDNVVNSVAEDNRVYQTGGPGEVTDNHNGDGDYSLIFYDPNFVTPDWHKQSVGYQIFVDRFFNGDTTNDPVGDGSSGDVIWWEWDSNGNGVADNEDEGRSYAEMHETWNEAPIGGYDYYGGDFQGIMAKADYLTDLGIDFIWTNPFSEAPDNHGYSVDDYRILDAYYGVVAGRDGGRVLNDFTQSMAFFDTFDQTLEAKGIKIVYDTVVNHASAQSEYFQRFESSDNYAGASGYSVPDYYPDVDGAFENPFNSYYPMFNFNEYNHNYDGWFGFNHIPTIIYDDDSIAMEELITGPNNIFDFWLDHGVDGFRLDVNGIYADGQGSRLVNQNIRNTVKSTDPNAIVMGEIWERASTWLAGNMNDGTQNMPFRFNTIDYLLGNYLDQTYSDLMHAIQENYPKEAYHSLWVNLGNHDRTRVLTALDGNKDLVKVASTLQFGYPGVPVVWYGDEVGVEGFGDPGTRQPYPWGSEDLNLLDHYKSIIDVKKSYPVMQEGDFLVLEDNQEGVIAFYRNLAGDANEHALVIGNRDSTAKRVTIDLDKSNIGANTIFADLLDSNNGYQASTNQIIIDIPAYGAMMLMSGILDSLPSESTLVSSSDTNSTSSDKSEKDDSPSISLGVAILSTLIATYTIRLRNRRN